MELIVAVYDDWGIGRDGTQPVALSADRRFFRETTRGCMVIVGRRTIEDFPGKKPLPGRVNVALTRSEQEIPGVHRRRKPLPLPRSGRWSSAVEVSTARCSRCATPPM